MDPILPSQGNAPAPMLQDVRGSAKRAIDYFHLIIGDAPNGSSGRRDVQLIGTDDADSLRAPLSYDAFEMEIDDISTESGIVRVRQTLTEVVARFGLYLDTSSWSSPDSAEEQVVAVRRGA
jgi:hypothetical protein